MRVCLHLLNNSQVELVSWLPTLWLVWLLLMNLGLEELFIKGSGKVQSGKSYRDFRGFLLEDGDNDVHSMREILDSLPKRQPTPLDGLVYERAQKGSSNGVMPGDPNYIELPEADDTVFHRWATDPNSSAQKLDKVIESGKADKARGMLDKLTKLSEDEFNALSLDDFKKMISK